MTVIKVNDLDISKLTFSDVKIDNNGRKMVFVNYNGGKVIVQTPKMYIPNGIKRWRKKDAVDNKDDSFELEMSFATQEKESKNSQDIMSMHSIMQEFDTMVKTHIMNHSKEMLGKSKMTMDLIENAFYSPTVRIATDKEGNVLDYPSRIRVKLDRERNGDDFTGRFLSSKRPPTEILVFDKNKNIIPLNESNFETVVPKGTQAVAILELVYLTITTKVSAKWKLIQTKVENNKQNITEYSFIDEEQPVQINSRIDTETVEDLDSDNLNEEELEIEEEELEEEQVEEEQVEPEPVVEQPISSSKKIKARK